jgi:hypothetical protein
MMAFAFVAAVVGLSAYNDVRKLPKGGNVQVLDANGDPIPFEDEGLDANGSWGFNWREELHKWMFGALPAPGPAPSTSLWDRVLDWAAAQTSSPPTGGGGGGFISIGDKPDEQHPD